MTQGLLFHPLNNGPLKSLPPERTSISKMAKIFGKSESTIERCLKNNSKMSEILRTKVREFAKINNFEFTNQKRYEAIKPEFLTGKKDRFGIPEINEALICQMRRDRMSIRNIKRVTGIQVNRIAKILKSSGLSTHDLKTKFDEKGLSERQKKAIEAHELRMCRLGLKQRHSTIRKKIAEILLEYKKNYTPIETQIANHGIATGTAWNYIRKSFVYNILKARKPKKYKGQKEKNWKELKSKRYKYEKEMYSDAYLYLKKIFPETIIQREVVISKTSSAGRGGYSVDFFIKDKNLCVEVKQRTTSCSNKTLYGQMFVYKSKGHSCAAMFPSDIVIPDNLAETLTSNGVQVMVLP